ncbi:MAG: DEAD/DEAH box helicase [Pararhodobacter sp.]
MTSPLTTLPPALQKALADKGYETLTPVQEAVLDPALAGRDLLVSAQTGSGKTVAFGLAMAHELLGDSAMLPPPDAPRALIIAPTRELALQVRREFEWLYASAGATIASCVGGMDYRTEKRALERGAHVVVATPGRLRDHIERETIDLSAVQAVALDEADEMLDLGFREDLEFILETLPPERRTLLFSATVSPGIEQLAQSYQSNAERVATAAQREAHGDITYRVLTVNAEDAENAIVNVLRYYEARNALVFCKTRAMVNHLTARFLNRGFPVVPLSGELAQDERARALQAMRDGRARVCVATDVAARGIDLPGLELVIHADLPTNKETLLHRSGRTGRAGRKGVSVLITPFSARRKVERLLGFAGVEAEWAAAPTAGEVIDRDTERLMTDPALTEPETSDEAELLSLLTECFSARELAAGVARIYFASRTPPEEITPVTAEGPKPRTPRSEFERSFWLKLGTGRAQRAEPRWLLPMLCRSGNLTKADIGAIRIFDDHTLVQLHEDSRERFFGALGDAMQLEQDISVAEAEAPAESDRPAPRSRQPRERRPDLGPRPKRDGFGDAPKHERAPHPARKDREDHKPHGDRREKAPREDRKPYGERPERKPRDDRKTYGDRPGRKPYGDTPERKPRAATMDAPDAKARAPRPERTERQRPSRAAAGNRPAHGDGPKGPRPDRAPGKQGFAPRGDKPAFSRSDKPARKPAGRSTGKSAEHVAEAPKGPRIDRKAAMDPSARLGGAKPRKPGKPGRPAGRGPDARPMRPRR